MSLKIKIWTTVLIVALIIYVWFSIEPKPGKSIFIIYEPINKINKEVVLERQKSIIQAIGKQWETLLFEDNPEIFMIPILTSASTVLRFEPKTIEDLKVFPEKALLESTQLGHSLIHYTFSTLSQHYHSGNISKPDILIILSDLVEDNQSASMTLCSDQPDLKGIEHFIKEQKNVTLFPEDWATVPKLNYKLRMQLIPADECELNQNNYLKKFTNYWQTVLPNTHFVVYSNKINFRKTLKNASKKAKTSK